MYVFKNYLYFSKLYTSSSKFPEHTSSSELSLELLEDSLQLISSLLLSLDADDEEDDEETLGREVIGLLTFCTDAKSRSLSLPMSSVSA